MRLLSSADFYQSANQDNIDMLGPHGHNNVGQHSLCGPNVGNLHRSNAYLLVGSCNQHDGSTQGQRVWSNVGSTSYPHLQNKFILFYLLNIHSFLYRLIFLKCCMSHLVGCLIFLEDGHNGTIVKLQTHIACSFFLWLFLGSNQYWAGRV